MPGSAGRLPDEAGGREIDADERTFHFCFLACTGITC